LGSPAAWGAAPRGRLGRQTVGWQARKAVKAVTGESYLTIRRFLLSGGTEQRPALKR
jgi:hypothetical protein